MMRNIWFLQPSLGPRGLQEGEWSQYSHDCFTIQNKMFQNTFTKFTFQSNFQAQLKFVKDCPLGKEEGSTDPPQDTAEPTRQAGGISLKTYF